MSYTKRQFVEAALEELGVASYTFDLTPAILQGAVRRLDAMMADWNGKGLRLAYPLPLSPENSDLDTPTDVPDYANRAVITNLAMRLAPSFGKTPNVRTMTTARAAYNTVLTRGPMALEREVVGVPSGAGNKNWTEPL